LIMRSTSLEKPWVVLFLLCSGADEENMRFISRCLHKNDALCKVQGLALESRVLADDMMISDIRDYPGQSSVQILRKIEPSLMVTGDDAGITYRAFVEAAKFLGIPSLLVTPGIIVGKVPFSLQNFKGVLWLLANLSSTFKRYKLLWASLRDCQWSFLQAVWFIMRDLTAKFYRTHLYGQGACSKIAVTGDYSRNRFIEEGIPPEKIVVTGLPRFDDIRNKTFESNALRRQLGLAPDRSVVALLTDAQVEHRLWTARRRRDFIKKVLPACQKFPDVQFVIKIHPYEDPTDYQRAVKELGWNIPVSKNIPLHELINASDAIMTGISTTGAETLIFNKPLLILNLYNQPEYITYVSDGVAIGIYHAEDIPKSIRAVLSDQQAKDQLASNRAGFLYHHLYTQDDRASERVSNLILEMTKHKYL